MEVDVGLATEKRMIAAVLLVSPTASYETSRAIVIKLLLSKMRPVMFTFALMFVDSLKEP